VGGAGIVAAEYKAWQQKLAPLGMRMVFKPYRNAREIGQTSLGTSIGKNTNDQVILQQDVVWTESCGLKIGRDA